MPYLPCLTEREGVEIERRLFHGTCNIVLDIPCQTGVGPKRRHNHEVNLTGILLSHSGETHCSAMRSSSDLTLGKEEIIRR